MKSVDVMKKGWYYNPERKETVYLDEKVYSLNDRFADLVVNEDGGDYADEEMEVKKLDYSDYDLTSGARKLAEAQRPESSGMRVELTKADDLLTTTDEVNGDG